MVKVSLVILVAFVGLVVSFPVQDFQTVDEEFVSRLTLLLRELSTREEADNQTGSDPQEPSIPEVATTQQQAVQTTSAATTPAQAADTTNAATTTQLVTEAETNNAATTTQVEEEGSEEEGGLTDVFCNLATDAILKLASGQTDDNDDEEEGAKRDRLLSSIVQMCLSGLGRRN